MYCFIIGVWDRKFPSAHFDPSCVGKRPNWYRFRRHAQDRGSCLNINGRGTRLIRYWAGTFERRACVTLCCTNAIHRIVLSAAVSSFHSGYIQTFISVPNARCYAWASKSCTFSSLPASPHKVIIPKRTSMIWWWNLMWSFSLQQPCWYCMEIYNDTVVTHIHTVANHGKASESISKWYCF